MAKIVHNPNAKPWSCAADGRMCYPNEWAVADDDVADRQAAKGRLVIIDPESIHDPGSDPVAILVKNQVQELNAPTDPTADTAIKAATKRTKK